MDLTMRSAIFAAALGAVTMVSSQAALAFTYEGQGGAQPTTPENPQAKAGYMDMDPGSLMPPIGQSVQGSSYDFGPGSQNNGWARQPTRSESVGPGWLYPPR
jgi:hypothetical protein